MYFVVSFVVFLQAQFLRWGVGEELFENVDKKFDLSFT
jgi:hypothetical protein